MLPNREAGVADGVGVGVGLCADNSPAATTVNASAMQKLIRVLPKTAAMYVVDQKQPLLASLKFCRCRKIYCVRGEPDEGRSLLCLIIIRRQ
jgi:hypothetical protein